MALSDIMNSFVAEYEPKASAFDPPIDELPDAVYDFEIVGQSFRTVNGKEILELTLRIIGGIQQFKYTYWFTSQFGLNKFGADLMAFGFDVKTSEKMASTVKALESKAKTLVGIKFRGKKKTDPNKQDPAKPYHTIMVLSLVGQNSGPALPPRGLVAPQDGPPDEDIPM
jgi:hypothetical protein